MNTLTKMSDGFYLPSLVISDGMEVITKSIYYHFEEHDHSINNHSSAKLLNSLKSILLQKFIELDFIMLACLTLYLKLFCLLR